MNRFIMWSARNILWIAALAFCRTLRIQRFNGSFFENGTKKNSPSVVAFWHGSMLLGWFLHRPRGGERVSALASQSADGEILSAVLQRWGYTMIRGSSHAGGKEALEQMVGAVKEGSSLCLTPDGSTGPRHKMKIGALLVAQQAQVPLFLLGIAVKRKITLGSWDMFEIPIPFSTASIFYSDPVWIPRDESGEPLNERLRKTEEELQRLQDDAEKNLI